MHTIECHFFIAIPQYVERLTVSSFGFVVTAATATTAAVEVAVLYSSMGASWQGPASVATYRGAEASHQIKTV